MNLLRATVELTHRNTRRYGGYLVHMGIVLMFIGFTGHAFNQNEVKELNTGDSMRVGTYDLRWSNLQQGENDELPVAPRHHGGHARTARCWARWSPRSASTKPAGRAPAKSASAQRPNEDLYLNFGGMSDDNQRAVIQAYVFPLVSWIWIGTLVLIFGTLVCLVPSKVKLQYARTEVVGIYQEKCNGSEVVCWF